MSRIDEEIERCVYGGGSSGVTALLREVEPVLHNYRAEHDARLEPTGELAEVYLRTGRPTPRCGCRICDDARRILGVGAAG